MEEVTGSAVLILLTFVTPAIPFFIALRLLLPKNRSVLDSDFAPVLLGCFLSLFVNADLFAFVGNQLVQGEFIREALSRVHSEAPGWEREVVHSLFALNFVPSPHRPIIFLGKFLAGIDLPPLNAVFLLIDLHLRTAIVAGVILLLARILSKLEDYILYLPYSKGPCEQKLATVLGISMDLTESKYQVEKTDRYPWCVAWLFGGVEWFRETFYDPWAYITHYFPMREFLVVDVLTDEGSLYSGVLVYFVPNEGGMVSVTLQYILRYLPDEKAGAPDSPLKQTRQSKHRKKVFIKNNGELTIPADQIVTVHIWEVRRRCEPDILIRCDADVEIFKWMVVLAQLKPDYFDRIRVHFQLDEHERSKTLLDLNDWLETQKLTDFPEKFFTFIGA